jgi:hypothetical protein
LGHEADHSLPSSAKVKNAWSYTSTPPVCLTWLGAQLKKAQGQLLLLLVQSLVFSYLLSKSVKTKMWKAIILLVLSVKHFLSSEVKNTDLEKYENKVVRKVFGPKREEVGLGGWRQLHNEELHTLSS